MRGYQTKSSLITGCRRLVYVAILLCGTNLYANTSGDDYESLRNELINHLLAREAAVDGLKVIVKIHRYIEKGTNGTPIDSFSADSLKAIEEYCCIFDQESMRAHHKAVWSSKPDHEQKEALYTYDGLQARSASIEPSSGKLKSGRISGVPPFEYWGREYLTLFSRDVMQLGHDTRFSDLLRTGLVSQSIVKDSSGEVIWVVAVPKSDMYELELHTARSVSGAILLSKVVLKVFDRPRSESDRILRASSEMRYGPPSTEYQLIPRSAEFLTMMYTSEQPTSSLTKIELIDVSQTSIELNTFRIPFTDDGLEIADERYRLAYKIGSNLLNIDGRIFVTSAPLAGVVGDDLDTWIADGHFDDSYQKQLNNNEYLDTGATSSPEASTSSITSSASYVFGGLLSILAILLVWSPKRRSLRNEKTS